MCEALPLKKCSKCGEEKSLLHFHKHKQSKDGHKSRCKICNNAEVRAYALANHEAVRERANKRQKKKESYSEEDWVAFRTLKQSNWREYLVNNPDKHEAMLARTRKANCDPEQWDEKLRESREWDIFNSEKKRATTRRYREENPKKYKAQSAVGHALRSGNLTKQPCEVCGELTVHAHHTDYLKPLEVMWLCPEHHWEWHRLYGEGLNGV